MLERRIGGFTHLLKALEYAAEFPEQRLCWFGGNGEVQHQLSYAQVFEKTRAYAAILAQQMDAAEKDDAGLGSRVGIVAVTGPDFLAAFCASQWAGGIPCPLPAPSPLQDLSRYGQTVLNMCRAAGISLLLGPRQLLEQLRVDGQVNAPMLTFEDLATLAASGIHAPPPMPEAAASETIAYVQFSSGSTGQPKGIAISQAALMHNVDAILQAGMALKAEDRAFSWLPYYHDMGLVGFVLAPLCGQVYVDYLAPSAFARRSHLWPLLMAERNSTITYAPNFAWQMAAKSATLIATDAQLHTLRIAGVGGDYVDYAALHTFAQAFAPHGFNHEAFKPSYGLAEATLAVTMSDAPFERLGTYFYIDEALSAHELHKPDACAKYLVNCGQPLPGWTLLVRDGAGQVLPAGMEGDIWIHGAAQLSGYFSTGVLQPVSCCEGVETGDRGFLTADGALYVTGRSKDLMIINGRNVWPSDVEAAASQNTGIAQEHMQLLKSGGLVDQQFNLVLLLHEKGVRQSPKHNALKLAAAAATAAAGSKVRACVVPNGAIAFTSSGKKARAFTLARFDNAQIPILADSEASH